MTPGKSCLEGWVNTPVKNPNIQSLDWGERTDPHILQKLPFHVERRDVMITFS